SLIDFLSWCDWAMPQRIDPDTNKPRARWEDVNYNDDLIGRYQKSMLKGSWSASKEPLAPSTINSRVEVAARFCRWTVQVGLRKTPFDIPYDVTYRKKGGLSSHSHD